MQKRSTKWYRKNEAEVMHRLGLKPTKNSGAGWIEKCDGENEHFLCEVQTMKVSVLNKVYFMC